MPRLDLRPAGLCRQGRPLLPEEGNQAAAPQGGVYVRRRQVKQSGLARWGRVGGHRASACRSRRYQAARIVASRLLTWVCRRPLSTDRDCAADSTCVEAEPVSLEPRCTSEMFEATSAVPCAACCTFCEISW